MKVGPEQCRAARALLGWPQPQLAKAAGVTRSTIADFERGATTPFRKTLETIRAVLEDAGIEFIDPNGGGPGARLRDNYQAR